MKLTCSHADLNAALRTLSRAVGTGKTHPILAGVCMVATDNGELHLTAYDLELGIHATIPAAVTTAGSTVVPYRLLSDITSRLSDAISLAVDGTRLTLAAASGSYSLSIASADDFPALPVVKADAADLVDISDLLSAVLLACSADAAKQILTGVHLVADGAQLRLEATDGHRLATRTMSCDAAALDVVIPARTLQMVRQPAAIACDNAHAAITLADGTRIISRILDGAYPNAQALIPATFKATLTADRITLLHALERVAVIADQHNSVVKLEASASALKLSAEAEANSGIEFIAADGKLPTLAVNAHYLIDGLRSMGGDTIIIQSNSSTAPVVLQGEPGQTYLLMPVQIRS
jgi:DNA polymerase-3 subunit beta